MVSAFHFSQDENGIGILVFDLPNEKVNKLSANTLEELEKIIDRLEKEASLKVLVLTSAKEGIFIAGADLKAFEPLFKDPSGANRLIGLGHRVFDKLSQLPFPTVAAIDGSCLGGGLELALACTYRVVSDRSKTSLGLPEVSLGIFPGWGGTQRLPRLVGLVEGLKMIVSGKPVNAVQAWKIKLADAIFPAEFFQAKVKEFLNYCTTPKGKEELLARRRQPGLKSLLLEQNPVGRAVVFWQTENEILKKTKGHYPAPLAALKLVKETYTKSLDYGLAKEAETFVDMMQKDFRQAPNLIQLFFAQEALKKNPGAGIQLEKASPIHAAGVLGAGIMGSGIAWLFTNADIPVRMKDINWDVVGKGCAAVWDNYQTLMKIKKMKPGEANIKYHRLSGAVDYAGFKHLDIMIEAAMESWSWKARYSKNWNQKFVLMPLWPRIHPPFTIADMWGWPIHKGSSACTFSTPPAACPLSKS